MTINDENGVPRDVERIHEELSGIHIEERPSFAPELESELRAAGVVEHSVRRHRARTRRVLVAAGVVGFLAVGSVPQARAALSRVLDTVRSVDDEFAGEAADVDVVGQSAPSAQFVPFEETEKPVPQPVTTAAWSNTSIDEIRPTIAYPKLKNPEEAERIVTLHYPMRLQQRGIGGNVRVLIWVDERGVVQDRQIVEGSGEAALDRAALNATERLRFEPARRQGDPVGSWVKFNIRFQPPESDGSVQPRIIEDLDGAEAASDPLADTSRIRFHK